MIGKLTGIVDQIYSDHIILDVNNVGYLVYVTNRTIANLPQDNSKISLFINMQVREDDLSLYGFENESEKYWFNKLISIKGIGPRLAMVILSNLLPEQLLNIIISQDKQAFSGISGVGKKIAERIVTELKDNKLFDSNLISTVNSNIPEVNKTNSVFDDAVSALSNLGYSRVESYNICSKVAANNPQLNTSELIRLSLKELAR